MKKWIIVLGTVLLLSTISISSIYAATDTPEKSHHNWAEYGVDYHEVDGGTHEYSYWKNFIKRNRTCQITHVIKTITFYCDKHDHTRSNTVLEKTKHSHHHSN
ncbi:hypothetical protein [Oceanobacillus sp. Castelsardo]|uniref:hypothetical protein n=1 Tax=Oceanobacillus sp. Castelsardo TaxID=1851204 RepID=UPI0008398C56|nr:hypothetical protein [Oceanobacillus sp. Castelsardo]